MIDATNGDFEAMRRRAMKAAMRAGVWDRSACDDVAQEVLIRAWRHGVFEMPPKVRAAWVRTTARRCAIDALRAARGDVVDEVDALRGPSATALSEERVDARRRVAGVVARAEALPATQRAVFEAVVCEGRAIEEVARALSVTRAVVDTRLRRMRMRLAA